ncbi:MAG: indole-3-glycerol-phosphate synthase [Armatimonadota bacterium]|nr:indole-3-glycerol-phosphate synthase [Armatimonadota bacterium]
MKFTEALVAARASGRAPLVAEIKCRSPKEGDLLAGRNPSVLARTYEAAGAACISVVTEPTNWNGSMELLRTVTSAVSIPVLRKDFITSAADIHLTKEAGASCVLLIVSKLDWSLLVELHEEAHRIGLETLVEAHDEAQLSKALTLDLDLLGINNRDITVLEKDNGTISRTLNLIRLVPNGVRVLSESSISTPDEVRAVIEAGALGILVGTSILRAPDPALAVRNLVSALET